MDPLWIFWSAPSGASSSIAGCPAIFTKTGDFKPVNSWSASCPLTVLKLELVPVAGNLTRDALLSNSMTFYAVPARDNTAFGWGTAIAYNTAIGDLQGARVHANCNDGTPATCNLLIKELPASLKSGPYALRVTSLYSTASDVKVIAAAFTGNRFINGQAVIDVTGKAQDVSRRIQVRVPLGGYGSDAAKFAVSTRESLCKKFAIGTDFVDDTGCPANIPNQ